MMDEPIWMHKPTKAENLLKNVIEPCLRNVGLGKSSPVVGGRHLGSSKIVLVGGGDAIYTVEVKAYQCKPDS